MSPKKKHPKSADIKSAWTNFMQGERVPLMQVWQSCKDQIQPDLHGMIAHLIQEFPLKGKPGRPKGSTAHSPETEKNVVGAIEWLLKIGPELNCKNPSPWTKQRARQLVAKGYGVGESLLKKLHLKRLQDKSKSK